MSRPWGELSGDSWTDPTFSSGSEQLSRSATVQSTEASDERPESAPTYFPPASDQLPVAPDVVASEYSKEKNDSPLSFDWAHNEIVIAGMSCRFPMSGNMAELAHNLLNGVDMITSDDSRWPVGYHGLPARHGKLSNIDKFDAAAFGIHPKQATNMDPQGRMLLEVVYEAMVDAGVNPKELRGSSTAVLVGISANETGAALIADPDNVVGYSLTGCAKNMSANRISYVFDLRGPSYALDTACSSSLQGLEAAVRLMRSGACDAAIVAGSHLTLSPTAAMQFNDLGMLSPDGRCHTFDSRANGYVRSEGVAAMLLQFKSCSRRSYCSILHILSNNDGYKPEGITFPNGKMQMELLNKLYDEVKVDPADVSYVEAHGTGTKVGDPQEAHAITEVFCSRHRSHPLLVGSVKTNLGHGEPVSGLAAVAKVLIMCKESSIPPNLHFEEPNPYIPSIVDGRLKVPVKQTPWTGSLIAVNSFGFGGSNIHALLRSENVPVPTEADTPLPKLFCFPGRTQEGVKHVLDYIADHPDDQAGYTLLVQQASTPSNIMPYRGYTLLSRKSKTVLETDVKKLSHHAPRPVWFIYSGMGSQWPALGRDLLRFNPCRRVISRASSALKPHGIDLYKLITTSDDNLMNSTTHSFIAIVTAQLALTDLLRSIGLDPAGYVGHSVGELGCSYADGCTNIEETVLSAYWRGRCVEEARLAPGAMAAVGLSWEETIAACPEGVTAACHNAADSVTVSGPVDAVREMVDKLKAQDIFAKEVKTSGVAFHSHYMKAIIKPLRSKLEKVIRNPKNRSSKWVSSSVREECLNEPRAKQSSPQYHVNNLTSPVLFHDAVSKIPDHAIVIEVSPHCLLNAVLRRSLSGRSIDAVALMKARHEDNTEFMMSNLGKAYQLGLDFSLEALYPPIPYPVPSSTTMVGSLVKWDHSQSWFVMDGCNQPGTDGKLQFEVDPFNPEKQDRYVLDHVIDGSCVYPFTGFLVMAWKALAKTLDKPHLEIGVIIEDVQLSRPTFVKDKVEFSVQVTSAQGNFEILDDESTLLCTGKIRQITDEKPFYNKLPKQELDHENAMNVDDIYKAFRLRGYDYGPEFRGVLAASEDGSSALVRATDNYCVFLDNVLQALLLSSDSEDLKLPSRLHYVRIDPKAHVESYQRWDTDTDTQVVPVHFDPFTEGISAGGVEARHLVANSVQRRMQSNGTLFLQKAHFLPYDDNSCLSHTSEYRQTLTKYNGFLNRMSELILERFSDLAESRSNTPESLDAFEELSRFLQDPSFQIAHILVKLYEKIGANNLISQARTALSLEQIQSDILYDSLYNQYFLKACTDIVTQNSPGHKPVNAFFSPISLNNPKRFKQFVETTPLVDSQWHIIGSTSTEEPPTPDTLSEHGLNDYFEWDADNGCKAEASVPKDMTLIVLDRLLCQLASGQRVKLYDLWIRLLKPEGFVIVFEMLAKSPFSTLVSLANDCKLNYMQSVRDWKAEFEANGFHVVATKTDPSAVPFVCFLLKRKSKVDAGKTLVVNAGNLIDFPWVTSLQKTLSDAEPTSQVWLCASSPVNGLAGLGLCLKEESSQRILARVLEKWDTVPNAKNKIDFHQPTALVKEAIEQGLSMNHVLGGKRGTLFHYDCTNEEVQKSVETSHAFVTSLRYGDLTKLSWVQGTDPGWWKENVEDTVCSIHYASINFRDIMFATGKLPLDAAPPGAGDSVFGVEFSGVIKETGERVMGIKQAQALATSVLTNPRFYWKIPDSWTLEEAATVPIVYLTVYYSLVIRANLQKGESVLIHSGAGGIGLSAITVAISLGAEVFVTVGTAEKKLYLQDRFPQIPPSHYADSRSTTFEFDLLHLTKGRGVDVVLNSLADDKLLAGTRCLATHGRFVEIGKYDMTVDTKIGMSMYLKNSTMHGINLIDTLYDAQTQKIWDDIYRLVDEGIKNNVIQPLPRNVFQSDKIEQAFRFMASGKHKGKVLICVKSVDTSKQESTESQVHTPVKNEIGVENYSNLDGSRPSIMQQRQPASVKALARLICNPEHIYIITGGLGGFGLELAGFLIARGARRIVLTSRSGVKTGYQRRQIKRWESKGCEVTVSSRNIANPQEAETLIRECHGQGRSIGGIFHLAMVLRDQIFENQTEQNFKEVAETKYWGTKNLDSTTRQHCCYPEFKWFVGFSSVAAAFGHEGQTCYGWANSVMERIIEQRRRDGYPGLAIQWGAIGDVGVVLDSMGDNNTVIGGTLPQRMHSCLKTLDILINQDSTVVTSYVRAPNSGSARQSGTGEDIVTTICRILGVQDASQMDNDALLGDLGLDSLMGVEIRQALDRDFNITLSMKDIRTLTLRKLKDMVNSGSAFESKPADLNSMIEMSPMQFFGLRISLNDLCQNESLVKMNDIDNGVPIFCLPSIEGTSHTLNSLAAELDVPCYCLQMTASVPMDSFETIAKYYVQLILNIQSTEPYHILGYSFGATIAYEITVQLESMGLKSRLILLDGSHAYMSIYRTMYRTVYQVETDLTQNPLFESEILSAFALRFANNVGYLELRQSLMKLPSWDERRELCCKVVMNENPDSDPSACKYATQSLHDKFQAADGYNTQGKPVLNAPVMLVKPTESAIPDAIIKMLGHDYQLSTVCAEPVTVVTVPGNHDTFIHEENARIAAEQITEFLS